MKKADVAYLAGIIDGEGTLSLHSRNKSGSTQIIFNVSNTCLPLLKHLKRVTGTGTIACCNRPKNPKWKIGYNWRVPQSSAYWLLPLLLPHLVVKKKQAKILLHYLHVLSTTKVKTSRRNRQVDKCIKKIQKLNRKGR